MATETISIPNYYWRKNGKGDDPRSYYIGRDGKRTRATEFKEIYLSDLVDNAYCDVSFSAYRNVDDISEEPKITSTKKGTIRSYNPVTRLLAVDTMKENPSFFSHISNNTKKIRYVDPAVITLASISSDTL